MLPHSVTKRENILLETLEPAEMCRCCTAVDATALEVVKITTSNPLMVHVSP